MATVIIVFIVWFTAVVLLAAVSVAVAPRVSAPEWLRSTRRRVTAAVAGCRAAVGGIVTALLVALAMWSVVIISGWLLGVGAHRLQDSIDWPAFRWWQERHIGGPWSTVWWKLTDVGSPRVTQGLALAGAILTALLYAKRPRWWAPGATLILGYLAERQSQIILKLVVDRGHPPTTHGTWPSGGMARLLVVYGLIIYFVIKRFWPGSARAWAAGWSLLTVCASVQAYARLNNLEHWTTDVVGGTMYGLLLLATMIGAYVALGTASPITAPTPRPQSVARPREGVP